MCACAPPAPSSDASATRRSQRQPVRIRCRTVSDCGRPTTGCLDSLDGRDPSDRATWDGTGSGAEALYGQYVRVPEGVALPAHLRDCPGCCVQLQAGDDIVAACQLTFAADIRAHATRLGLSDEDRERIVALNMAACIAVCGFFSMAAGDRVRITRMECYGGDLEESASTTPTARA